MDVLQQVQVDTSIASSGSCRSSSSSNSVYHRPPLKKRYVEQCKMSSVQISCHFYDNLIRIVIALYRRKTTVASSSSLSGGNKTSKRQQSLHQDGNEYSYHLPLTPSPYTALTSGLEESMSVYVAAAAAFSTTTAYYSVSISSHACK